MLIGVSGQNYGAKITARCAVFSSDLTFMSKNEHWLLVFMALGENLKISIFDPPSVGGTYKIIIIIKYIIIIIIMAPERYIMIIYM